MQAEHRANKLRASKGWKRKRGCCGFRQCMHLCGALPWIYRHLSLFAESEETGAHDCQTATEHERNVDTTRALQRLSLPSPPSCFWPRKKGEKKRNATSSSSFIISVGFFSVSCVCVCVSWSIEGIPRTIEYSCVWWSRFVSRRFWIE